MRIAALQGIVFFSWAALIMRLVLTLLLRKRLTPGLLFINDEPLERSVIYPDPRLGIIRERSIHESFSDDRSSL